MPTAPLYDPTTFFYYGSPSNPTTEAGRIYESYPGLSFTVGVGDDAYNADPYGIEQRFARDDLLGYAYQLANEYPDIPPLPTHLGLSADDAQYVRDLAVFLNRSGQGIPIQGGKYGDNAGDGPGIGSILSNEFVIAALATGLAGGGAQLLSTAPEFGAAVPAGTAGAIASPAPATFGPYAGATVGAGELTTLPAVTVTAAAPTAGAVAPPTIFGLTIPEAVALGSTAVGVGGTAASFASNPGGTGNPSANSANTAPSIQSSPSSPTPGNTAPASTLDNGFLGTGLSASQAARLGATAISTGTALAGGGNDQTTTSRVNFPPETRNLIGGVEFPLLAGAIDEQSALLGPLLAGQPFAAQTAGQFGTRVPNTVRSAARTGAQTAGIGDLGPVFDDINVLQPQLLGALRSLALQRGAQSTSVVPPGFQPFLAPSTSQKTEGGGPGAFETGFQLAGTLGSAYLGSR